MESKDSDDDASSWERPCDGPQSNEPFEMVPAEYQPRLPMPQPAEMA